MATPVWVVRKGDHLYVTTQADSGKVKRLRNNSDVLLAPCDVRGNLTGAQVPGEAVVLDEKESAQVESWIKSRYGIVGRLMILASALRRRPTSVGLKITPN